MASKDLQIGWASTTLFKIKVGAGTAQHPVALDLSLLFTYNLVRGLGDLDPQILTELFQCATLKGRDLLNVGRHVENVDISERLTRFENPEDIKYLVGIAGC